MPLSERLSAYGKLGIAQPGQERRPAAPGATAIGAKLKVNERTTISAEARSNGSASKFDSVSNASGLRGSVDIGF